MTRKARYPWLLSLCFLGCLFTACTGASTPKKSNIQPGIAVNTPTPIAGGPACKPASQVIIPQGNQTPAGAGLPQMEGKAPGGQLWALFFNGWPMRAHQQNKIVWRMTGTGDLNLVANGPGGQVVHPSDVIYHESSSWDRPGEEWGSSFVFPVPGCWDIHASREKLTGDVWIEINA